MIATADQAALAPANSICKTNMEWKVMIHACYRFFHSACAIMMAIAVVFLVGTLLPADAIAQTGPELQAPSDTADQVSTDEVDRLIETIREPSRRDELLRQLEILRLAIAKADGTAGSKQEPDNSPVNVDSSIVAAIASLAGKGNEATDGGVLAQEDGVVKPEGILKSIGGIVEAVSDNIAESWSWVGQVDKYAVALERRFSQPQVQAFWALLSYRVAIVLLVAIATGTLAYLLLRFPVRKLASQDGSVSRRIVRAGISVALRLLPPLFFALSGYVMMEVQEMTAIGRVVTMALINAQTTVLIVLVLCNIDLGGARRHIVPSYVSDRAIRFLRAACLRLTVTLSYGVMTVELLSALALPMPLVRLAVHLVGLAALLVVLHGIIGLRRRVPIDESGQGGWRRYWYSAAIAISLTMYLLWMTAPVEMLLFALRSAILTIAIGFALRATMRFIGRVFARQSSGEGWAVWRTIGSWRRAQIYIDILERGAIGFLCALAGVVILEIWGVDIVAWVSQPEGQAIVGGLFKIIVMVVGGIAISEIFSIVIEAHLQRRVEEFSDLTRRSRARTLLPLLRNVMRVALGTIITLLVLTEIGIDIGPLLAAAGVVGLAVGFGAQTLVRDIITGVLILAEDTMAVGDVVDLDGNSGVVESMTIRTVRLRDLSGTVHTVPFSAIAKVKNMTRDFSYALFDVGVSYGADLSKVMELLAQIAAEQRQDDKWRYDILDAMEVLGVERFDDSAVIVRARIKTKPIRQWDVARDFNRRMKIAFDAAGIEIPFPQRTLHIARPDVEGLAKSGPEKGPVQVPA